MAKKKTSAGSAKKTRGGTSKQHARAGRLGGLAPHVCRGSECTKLRKEAAAKAKAKKAGASKKTAAKKATSVKAKAGSLKATTAKAKAPAASKAKKATALKAKATKASKAKKVTVRKTKRSASTSYHPELLTGLFEDMYAMPAHSKRASKTSRAKKAATRRGHAKKVSSKSRRSLWE